MLKTYLKVAIRQMLRNKSFTIINVGGLFIGLVSFLAISLYVIDEYSYDRYHKKKDRIYRAIISASFDGQVQRWGSVPNAVAPTVAKEVPEVEKSSRLFHHNFGDIAFLQINDDKFSETELYYADPEIFDLFTIEMLQGSKTSALNREGTAIISEGAAARYFNGKDPIGQVILVDNRTSLEVTGVYKDFPANSILKCQIIASFASNYFGKPDQQSWGNASFDTYFLLHPGTSKEIVDSKIEDVLARNIRKDNRWYTITLQALTDIHLYSGDLTASIDRKQYGDIDQIKILMAMAIVILMIAVINYMNLTTAQSQRRNKEVGVSKTLGAQGIQLKVKFYFETGLVVLFAIILSIGFFVLLLPQYNQLTGKAITITFLTSPFFLTTAVTLWLLLTLLAGFYPANYLSAFSPKAALSKTNHSGGQVIVRKALVITQFSASVVLIIAAVIFVKQMNFIRDKNLGYEPEQVIAIMTSATRDQNLINSLKTEFESLSDVKSVCRSQSYPGIGTSGYTITKSTTDQQGASIASTASTSEILDVLGINLLAGTSLPVQKSKEDTTIQVVLNKSAVDYLNLSPEEAIGKNVYIYNGQPSEVVGVMEDFHFASMHQKIGPYCFTNNKDNVFTYLLVKVSSENLQKTVEALQAKFEKIIPAAFEYTFLDEQMNKLYQAEQKLTRVVLLASTIAILIACLGLYSLAAYTAEQRIKEIGIRKVMGATVAQLVIMLSSDFVKLIVIAFVVGLPAGYYFMNQWLSGFAYKTDLDAWLFIFAATLTMTIAIVTVSLEAIKAAVKNPVKALRSE